ncbi:hypothetical protein KQH40_01570 [bacterium]|nr:hypothetical protein [bacterium]
MINVVFDDKNIQNTMCIRADAIPLVMPPVFGPFIKLVEQAASDLTEE